MSREVVQGTGGVIAEVHSAAAEVGQGVPPLLVQIAREELGIDTVVLHPADTSVGSAGSSSASRQTMMSGGAVQMACRAVRDVLFERARHAGLDRELAPDIPLAIRDGQIFAGARRVGALVEFLDEPIEQTRVYHHRKTTPLDRAGQGDPHVTFAFAAQRAVVEVDEDLGLVRVVQIAAARTLGMP